MRSKMIRKLDQTEIPLTMLIRVALGAYFIYSGLEKAGVPTDFLKNIHLYQMMPEDPPFFLNAVATVMPWLEIVCGTALVLGVGIRGAAANLLVMLLVFSPAILLRALAIRAEEGTPFFEIAFDCGCGAGVVVTWRKLCFNGMLIVGGLVVLFARSRKYCLSRWFDRLRGDAAHCRACGRLLPARGNCDCNAESDQPSPVTGTTREAVA